MFLIHESVTEDHLFYNRYDYTIEDQGLQGVFLIFSFSGRRFSAAHDLVQFLDHLVVFKTELHLHSPGGVLVNVALGVQDGIGHGVTVDGKVILKLLALLRAEEVPLDIQKILRHGQRSHLGKIQVITVISVGICISVYNDLGKILGP